MISECVFFTCPQLQQQLKAARPPRQTSEDTTNASREHRSTSRGAKGIDMSDLDDKPVKEGKVKRQT